MSIAPAAKRSNSARPRTPTDSHESTQGEHLTDNGNARRVVHRHGADLRYCHPWKQWLVWDSVRWKQDDTAEAERRVKETRDSLFQWANKKIKELGEAGEQEDEDEEMKRKTALKKLTKALAHCLTWEDARRVSASMQLARSEPGMPILTEELDRDPWLLNCLNGTMDLRTGHLRPHRHEDLLTKLAPVHYDASAFCPQWLKFLDRIMAGNQDLVDYLQRVVGYGLTGDVREQCLFFFHGDGMNGKSTFLGIIQAMLGDYAMQAVSELLMMKHNEAHPTERADLSGMRFVATIETEEGKRLAEALVKQCTGGDRIRARWMRENFFEFDATHKIFLAANHKPAIRGRDLAIWRRIKLVPFNVTIPEEERDKTLPDKLKAELPGILAWAVRGCLAWQQNGLGEPEEVKQATDGYRAEQDVLAGFITECCYVGPEARIRFAVLYEAFKGWCKRTGEEEISGRAFGHALQSRKLTDYTSNGTWYKGIKLTEGTEQCSG